MPERESKSQKAKIIHLEEAKKVFERLKDRHIVLVGGCYDILHFGHLDFLRKSSEEGNMLVIALESDEFITKSKTRKPIHNQDQRAQILASLEFVDIVIKLPLMQGHEDYLNLVKAVMPKIIAVTYGDPKYKYKKNHADAVGAEIKEVCKLDETFSSTQILQYANIFRD
ncbi:MAG: Glycerol-3-phosphate cytidyltransferase TagD [Candidatus Parcubacteria bacterium]|jgi:cytidyltransferase-like protein